MALHAGMLHASAATTEITAMTSVKVIGSVGVTPKSGRLEKSRLSNNAPRHADRLADRRQQDAQADHHRQHGAAPCPKRHADSDLLGPLRHRVVDDS